VLGAVVPAYNVPGISGEIKFTPEALAGIFLGKVQKWNDPAITQANPGVKFPDKSIIVDSPLRWQRHNFLFSPTISRRLARSGNQR
jgi:ABC-type phosphate transport system substrate-binding protein